MSELKPVSLRDHLESIVEEFNSHQSIYGYKDTFFHRWDAQLDFSVRVGGKKVATPLGPAAGPHTQLAQNILLSWLHGSRIIELKTIQVLDDLQIPRPCIDMRNLGYNVEWSQELSLADSLKEYATAWILIHLMPYLEIFNCPVQHPFYLTIFDMSIGYDLAGISSEKVSKWLQDMRDAKFQIRELIDTLPPKFYPLTAVEIPSKISDTVTLSTFHGCPANEIEEIVKYLIAEHNLHVVVKMNPTLGGFEETQNLLKNELGYHNIDLDPDAFTHDLNFDQAIEMMQRLNNFARQHKKTLGAKFTNTLVVKNSESIFDGETRYLSGAPLYVLATHLAYKFRSIMGPEFPVSFSGGINKTNFPQAVAANMAPVTTCSDLLKKGGYKKLSDYMINLRQAMQKNGAQNISEFISVSSGNSQDPAELAGQKNLGKTVNNQLMIHDYHYQKNKAIPKKIDSQLKQFDCLSCNICLPVCPNAANFNYFSGRQERSLMNFGQQAGQLFSKPAGIFKLEKEYQIGTIADFCNQCGNCDTFCPELGGPYLQKFSFFKSQKLFQEDRSRDGFYFENDLRLHAHIAKRKYLLEWHKADNLYRWCGTNWQAYFDTRSTLVRFESKKDQHLHSLPFEIMRTIFDGFRSEPRKYPQFMLMSCPESE